MKKPKRISTGRFQRSTMIRLLSDEKSLHNYQKTASCFRIGTRGSHRPSRNSLTKVKGLWPSVQRYPIVSSPVASIRNLRGSLIFSATQVGQEVPSRFLAKHKLHIHRPSSIRGFVTIVQSEIRSDVAKVPIGTRRPRLFRSGLT